MKKYYFISESCFIISIVSLQHFGQRLASQDAYCLMYRISKQCPIPLVVLRLIRQNHPRLSQLLIPDPVLI
jgi:hypothetical protein